MNLFSSSSAVETPERSEIRGDILEEYGIMTSEAQYALQCSLSGADPTNRLCCDLEIVLKSSKSIPNDFVRAYCSQVPPLHSWQSDLIQLSQRHPSINIALSAPTSSGKTLVAEVAIINMLFASRSRSTTGKPKKVLYIAPYKEIIDQKYERFSSVLPFIVRKLKGRDSFSTVDYDHSKGIETEPMKIIQSADVAVSTYEMAGIAIDKMVEDGTISDLGLVIIDEIHFVSELGRGNKLESTLTQLVRVNHHLRLKKMEEIQLLAMSGSMKNPRQIASWLGGYSYVTDYRPIPVDRFIVSANGNVLRYNELTKELSLVASMQLKRPQMPGDYGFFVFQLILHKLSGGGRGGLVFVNSQKEAVNLAKMLINKLTHSDQEEIALLRTNDIYRWNSAECMEHGLDIDVLDNKELTETITSWGIAFHHGSLSDSDRQFVVHAYNKGFIKCIIATTTLAVGANLAAEMVIVHGLEHGGHGYMSPVLYGQMEGRGGRPGLSNSAEIYVINKKDNLHPRLIAERYFETKGLVDLESRLLPPNIADVYLGKKATEEAKASLRCNKRKRNDEQSGQQVDHLRNATRDFQQSLLQSLASPLFPLADGARRPIPYHAVLAFFRSTLVYHLQSPLGCSDGRMIIKKVGLRALLYLLESGLVTWDNYNQTYNLTDVGAALGLSGLPIDPALKLITATNKVFSGVEVHENQMYSCMFLIYSCLKLFSSSADIRKVFDIEENFWRNWLEYYNNIDPFFQNSAILCGISSSGHADEFHPGAHAQPNANLQQLCRNANVRHGGNVREKHKTFLAAMAFYEIIVVAEKPMQVYNKFCKSQRFNKRCVSELAFKNCLKEFKQVLEQVGCLMKYLYEREDPHSDLYGGVCRCIDSLKRGLCEVMTGLST